MIATCPACGKRYRIPDDAVPAGGRSVRCAACGNGWTAFPDGAGAPSPVDLAEASDVASREITGPAAPLPSLAVAVVAPDPAPVAPESAWMVGDETPPRRRWGWLVAVLLALAALAAVAVVEFAPADTFDPPRLGLPAPADLLRDLPPLDLTRVPVIGDRLDRLVNPLATLPSPLRIAAHGERRRLANGTRLLTVAGTVANPTATPVALAGIDAALLDPAGHAAFRWRIAAPASVVGAGQGVAFEAVAANYPANATVLQLTPR